jgi:hypothetical protein
MPGSDPIMAVQDRLPLGSSPGASPGHDVTPEKGPVPFGVRFAMTPKVPCDRHKKTYYTVTVKEATQISRDGRVETIQDDVQRERED